MDKLGNTTYSVVIKRLAYDEALMLVKLGENDYDNPLSQLIDIEFCAKKWSDYAHFLIVKDNEKLVSLLVFYMNSETSMIYVTHFVVSSVYRSNGIGKEVLKFLHEYVDSICYESIQLEVYKNSIAYNLYKRLGYVEIENRGNKQLMKYTL